MWHPFQVYFLGFCTAYTVLTISEQEFLNKKKGTRFSYQKKSQAQYPLLGWNKQQQFQTY